MKFAGFDSVVNDQIIDSACQYQFEAGSAPVLPTPLAAMAISVNSAASRLNFGRAMAGRQ